MRINRGGIGQGGGNAPRWPMGKDEARKHYLKYFDLALSADKKKDRALFERHYRLTEYYQDLIDKLNAPPVFEKVKNPAAPFKADFPLYDWEQFVLRDFTIEIIRRPLK